MSRKVSVNNRLLRTLVLTVPTEVTFTSTLPNCGAIYFNGNYSVLYGRLVFENFVTTGYETETASDGSEAFALWLIRSLLFQFSDTSTLEDARFGRITVFLVGRFRIWWTSFLIRTGIIGLQWGITEPSTLYRLIVFLTLNRMWSYTCSLLLLLLCSERVNTKN